MMIRLLVMNIVMTVLILAPWLLKKGDFWSIFLALLIALPVANIVFIIHYRDPAVQRGLSDPGWRRASSYAWFAGMAGAIYELYKYCKWLFEGR